MRNKRGYTLVECLMVLGILSFVLLAVYGVLVTGNAVYNKDSVMMDIAQQVRGAMSRITKEVRESGSSTITNTDADSYKIVFSTPSKTGVQFYRQNNQLIYEYPTGTTKVIATNIGRLYLSKTNQLLTIEIRADKTVYHKTFSVTFVEKVRLRNE